MHTRQYHVGHSKDGWVLLVNDEHVVFWAAEALTFRILEVLGHPCCGKGILGAFPSYPEHGWLGEQAQVFWWRVLNLPNKLYYLNKHVTDIPLTRDQAFAMAPDWVSERESWDEDEQ